MSTNDEIIHSSNLTPTIYEGVVSNASKELGQDHSVVRRCSRYAFFDLAEDMVVYLGPFDGRTLGCTVPIWVLTTEGGGEEEHTYWNGDQDSNGNSSSYSDGSLSVVV